VTAYLSPISNKLSRSNKENINMFEEVSNLLKQYQQNPLKSTYPVIESCLEKSSVPVAEQNILKEVRRKLRSK
jgi:hypothetical protein